MEIPERHPRHRDTGRWGEFDGLDGIVPDQSEMEDVRLTGNKLGWKIAPNDLVNRLGATGLHAQSQPEQRSARGHSKDTAASNHESSWLVSQI
jgi:hypothetical protein